jgi:hypothetical protein
MRIRSLMWAELPLRTFRTEDRDLRRLVLVVSEEATPASRGFVADCGALGAGQAVGHTAQSAAWVQRLNWLF